MTHKQGWFCTNNIYKFLALKILWAFIAILLTQVAFYVFNTHIFNVSDSSEWWGIVWGNVRFGLASVSAFMLPYLIMMLLPFNFRWKNGYRLASEIVFLVPMLVALVANMADVAYYQFTYRRISSEIFVYLTIGGDMGNLLPRFLVDYWYATVSGIVIFVLFILFSVQTRLTSRASLNNHTTNDLVGSIVSLAVIFIFLRGGFTHTIQLSDSARYCQMKNTAMVINSPYNILRTSLMDDLGDEHTLLDSEALALYNPETHFAGTGDSLSARGFVSGGGTFSDSTGVKHQNVVVIILESFSQEYMGCYNGGKEPSFTPFLDSLAQHSFVFNGRSNGKKSVESIPAVMASIPTLTEKPFILSQYYKNDILGLPAVLKQYGYHSAFFHGSYNGSMNFDKFCKKAGFDEYYGKNEYEAQYGDKDYDKAWGIYDEPFLQYMAQRLSTFKEPFFAGVFTISSHHPYSIPEQHKGQFKQGKHPLLQCVMYSDYALRQFFATASRQPWYKNTLFVIMGDHPGQGLSREYNDYNGWYRIPMIFYSPKYDNSEMAATGVKPYHSTQIVQQIDVMPTIVDYLGIKMDAVCFGSSVMGRQQGYQVYYGNGYHALVRDNGSVAAYEGSQAIGNPNDLKLLHAIVQTYNKRMRNNQLTLK